MTTETIEQIATMLALALVFLFVNLKAGTDWLKFVSLAGLLGFLGGASLLAIAAVLR